MRIQISLLSLHSRVMQHSRTSRRCVMCRRCSCSGVASDCHTHFAHTHTLHIFVIFTVLIESARTVQQQQQCTVLSLGGVPCQLLPSCPALPRTASNYLAPRPTPTCPSPLTIGDLRKLLCFSQKTQTINKLKNAALTKQTHTQIYIYNIYTYIAYIL